MIDENMIQQVMRIQGLNRADAKRKIERAYAQQLAQTKQPMGGMVADKYVKPHDTQRAAAMIKQLMGMHSMGKIKKAQDKDDLARDDANKQYMDAVIRALGGGGEGLPTQPIPMDPAPQPGVPRKIRPEDLLNPGEMWS